MKYKKGKQFESAVEMFEWLHNGGTVFNHIADTGNVLTIGRFN